MEVKKLDYSVRDGELSEVLPLRDSVLHWTLHPLDNRKRAKHIVVVNTYDESIIGAVSYVPLDKAVDADFKDAVLWRGYGFAVAPLLQKAGIGEALLHNLLDKGRIEGVDWIIAHAALSAISYYESRGAECYGEEFFDYNTKLTSHRVRFKVPSS